ncbi:MAG: hypothetical protein ABR985_11440 [Methanotrichaceae archaeon]|jgi:hypothetical protein
MVSLSDIAVLRSLWKWADGNWKRILLASLATLIVIVIILCSIVILVLTVFYKPEDRWSVLSGWLLSIMGWVGIGAEWFSVNMLAILIVVVTFVVAAIIITGLIMLLLKRELRFSSKVNGYKKTIYNVWSAYKKLEMFPYKDGTPVGKNKAYEMGFSSVVIDVPNLADLDEAVKRVNEKDANIAELLERAKDAIIKHKLYE